MSGKGSTWLGEGDSLYAQSCFWITWGMSYHVLSIIINGIQKFAGGSGLRKLREGPKTLWNRLIGRVINRNFDQSSHLSQSPFPSRSYILAMASHTLPLKRSAVSLEYIIPLSASFCLVFHPLHTSGHWSLQFAGALHPRSSPQALVLPA